MRKKTSENYSNKVRLENECGMAFTLSLVSGRWKPLIFWKLVNCKLRYGELKRSIVGISERMLISQLKEMEADGMVKRTAFPEVPPRVEYELTDLGHSLVPIFLPLCDWGKKQRKKRS